eukprot:2095214-Rhodomonas_salina.2
MLNSHWHANNETKLSSLTPESTELHSVQLLNRHLRVWTFWKDVGIGSVNTNRLSKYFLVPERAHALSTEFQSRPKFHVVHNLKIDIRVLLWSVLYRFVDFSDFSRIGVPGYPRLQVQVG